MERCDSGCRRAVSGPVIFKRPARDNFLPSTINRSQTLNWGTMHEAKSGSLPSFIHPRARPAFPLPTSRQSGLQKAHAHVDFRAGIVALNQDSSASRRAAPFWAAAVSLLVPPSCDVSVPAGSHRTPDNG